MAITRILEQPTSYEVSDGDSARFSVSALPSLLSYQWYIDGVKSGGNSSGLSFTAGLKQTGALVFCEIYNSDTDSTTSTSTVTLTVNEVVSESFVDIVDNLILGQFKVEEEKQTVYIVEDPENTDYIIEDPANTDFIIESGSNG